MPKGKVKWFNTTKGFGFIAPDEGGNDVFVHISAVEQSGMTGLADDMAVEYDLVEGRDTMVFVARLDGAIVGSLTLALYRIPTGVKAWIEDVVVDDAARGHGLGRRLSEAAIDEARARGAKNVSLTSRASREAANRLYQRIGFEVYDTNLYRFSL